MESVLKITAATKENIKIIRDIAQNVWPQTYAEILTPQQIEYMLDLLYSERSLTNQIDAGHKFIIAYNLDVPMGFASYSEIEKDIYKLHKLYILSGEQGRGIGRFLIDHIISEIRSKEAKCLRLNVNRHNKARSFYEKTGFSIIGSEDIDIGNGYYMNDYIMERSI